MNDHLVLAHAGEEALPVLLPILLLVVFLIVKGRRDRRAEDEGGDADSQEADS